MESIDDLARAAGEERRQAGLKRMLESRSRAPRLYCKALLLHHVLAGALAPDARLARDLEGLVLLNPDRARDVIGALECAIAEGGRYEAIASALHAMLSRHAARQVINEIEKGMK